MTLDRENTLKWLMIMTLRAKWIAAARNNQPTEGCLKTRAKMLMTYLDVNLKIPQCFLTKAWELVVTANSLLPYKN